MMQELYTDEQLMARMSSGDQQALEQLFRKYYTPLVRFAREILRNTEQAEDMVQEVFTKIWTKRESIDITTYAKSYLYVAVKNHCFNMLKQNEKKHWMDESMEDDIRLSTADTSGNVDAKKLESDIHAAIDKLPPKCGLIFKMSRFEDKSYKEIAEALELSVKTVENQMGKALALLRTALGPYLKDLVSILLILVFWRP
jgi:RNA polymerase sigma-70 factor (ECF subfamily)